MGLTSNLVDTQLGVLIYCVMFFEEKIGGIEFAICEYCL